MKSELRLNVLDSAFMLYFPELQLVICYREDNEMIKRKKKIKGKEEMKGGWKR